METTYDIGQAILLGIVQGLTEFLPISSTAHLKVVPGLLHLQDPGVAYSAVIQLGSVLAVIAYFSKDLMLMLKGAFIAIKNKDISNYHFRLFASIIIGTIPICVLGLILKPILELNDSPLRSYYVIGSASILMGLLLLLAEKIAKRQRTIEQIRGLDGFLVGLGQALALIPGCSRSGSTLTVSLFLNLKREDAARFSFLLGIPAIVLSGLLELKELLKIGLSQTANLAILIGLITSTLVSYFAIWWMLKFLKTNSTTIFIIYRFIFGCLVIGLTFIHYLN